MTIEDLTFNAIDVETANNDRASICQIGIVHVVNGNIVETWQTLVDPEDWFDPLHVGIHGISEDSIENSPTLPFLREELRRRLRGSILVSHSAFDRVAFERAMDKYDLEQLRVTWLDSLRIARRTWLQFADLGGYSLKNIAYHLGISFKHHDALEDARAAAEITIRAVHETGIGVEEWIRGVEKPIRRKRVLNETNYEKIDLNPEGHLFGEALVFTGKLSIPRPTATYQALSVGCEVLNSVSARCSLLVVGLQNRSRLSGYDKSSKHRKAEELIARGHSIQIISESDFFELVQIN